MRFGAKLDGWVEILDCMLDYFRRHVISRLAAVTAVMEVAKLSEALYKDGAAYWRLLYKCAKIEKFGSIAMVTVSFL